MTVEAAELDTAGGGSGGGEGVAISPWTTSPLRLAVDSLRFGPAHGRGSYDRPSEVPMSASEADEADRRCRPALVGRDEGSSSGRVSESVGYGDAIGASANVFTITEHPARAARPRQRGRDGRRTSPNDGPLLRGTEAEGPGVLPTRKLCLASGEVARSGWAESERGSSARGDILGWCAARAGEDESGEGCAREGASPRGVMERREASAEGGRPAGGVGALGSALRPENEKEGDAPA